MTSSGSFCPEGFTLAGVVSVENDTAILQLIKPTCFVYEAQEREPLTDTTKATCSSAPCQRLGLGIDRNTRQRREYLAKTGILLTTPGTALMKPMKIDSALMFPKSFSKPDYSWITALIKTQNASKSGTWTVVNRAVLDFTPHSYPANSAS